jgi:hypothetical protein
MDVENSIEVFGETEVWVECDLCGCVYGGPGTNKEMVAAGQANVCVDCLRTSTSNLGNRC